MMPAPHASGPSNDAREVARHVWDDQLRPELIAAFVPILRELDGKLQQAQRVNDLVRQAGALMHQARPKEIGGTGLDFIFSWPELSDGDTAKPTVWRQFVERELQTTI